MLLLGRTVSANEAHSRFGLWVHVLAICMLYFINIFSLVTSVNWVVPQSQVLPTAIKVAKEMTQNSPDAVQVLYSQRSIHSKPKLRLHRALNTHLCFPSRVAMKTRCKRMFGVTRPRACTTGRISRSVAVSWHARTRVSTDSISFSKEGLKAFVEVRNQQPYRLTQDLITGWSRDVLRCGKFQPSCKMKDFYHFPEHELRRLSFSITGLVREPGHTCLWLYTILQPFDFFTSVGSIHQKSAAPSLWSTVRMLPGIRTVQWSYYVTKSRCWRLGASAYILMLRSCSRCYSSLPHFILFNSRWLDLFQRAFNNLPTTVCFSVSALDLKLRLKYSSTVVFYGVVRVNTEPLWSKFKYLKHVLTPSMRSGNLKRRGGSIREFQK